MNVFHGVIYSLIALSKGRETGGSLQEAFSGRLYFHFLNAQLDRTYCRQGNAYFFSINWTPLFLHYWSGPMLIFQPWISVVTDINPVSTQTIHSRITGYVVFEKLHQVILIKKRIMVNYKYSTFLLADMGPILDGLNLLQSLHAHLQPPKKDLLSEQHWQTCDWPVHHWETLSTLSITQSIFYLVSFFKNYICSDIYLTSLGHNFNIWVLKAERKSRTVTQERWHTRGTEYKAPWLSTTLICWWRRKIRRPRFPCDQSSWF